MPLKALFNSLDDDKMLKHLTEDEFSRLRQIFLRTYKDLQSCCEKYGLTVILLCGTALGAVRHKGFIPWDDDFDVGMTREDFEKLKLIFDKELGYKYILSSPNHKGIVKNRFPQVFVKGTTMYEIGSEIGDPLCKIKIDIFIIENAPNSFLLRCIKGLLCNTSMFIASNVGLYQNKTISLRKYMCKTFKGTMTYVCKRFLGFLFSFISLQQWFNIVDRLCMYSKKTNFMCVPTSRGHYFGEIRPSKTFIPFSVGVFECISVKLPGNTNDYLSHLYGSDYMKIPEETDREKHFICDISFEETGEDNR